MASLAAHARRRAAPRRDLPRSPRDLPVISRGLRHGAVRQAPPAVDPALELKAIVTALIDGCAHGAPAPSRSGGDVIIMPRAIGAIGRCICAICCCMLPFIIMPLPPCCCIANICCICCICCIIIICCCMLMGVICCC